MQYVVVRNDLQRSNDVPDPVLVHQALAASRGLSLAATFGPDVGGGAAVRTPRGRVLVNGGWQSQYPAIEIFEVDFVDDAVTAEVLPTVVGGPEDLLALADAGLARSEPTRLAADSDPDADPEGPVVLTDGMLDRERFFGRVHDGASSVITPGDVRRSGNPTKDYLLPGGDRWRTTARLVGASTLSASSSQSDANAGGGGARPGDLPYAALDGLDDTEWLSAGARDEWWQVDLDQPRSLQAVTVTAGKHGSSVQRVRVETPAGISEVLELEPGDSTTVQVGGTAGRVDPGRGRRRDPATPGDRRGGGIRSRRAPAARAAGGARGLGQPGPDPAAVAPGRAIGLRRRGQPGAVRRGARRGARGAERAGSDRDHPGGGDVRR